jgi:predicted kinase
MTVGMDAIRHDMSLSVSEENNEIAFKRMLKEINTNIKEGQNTIVDCGLVKNKLERLEDLVKKTEKTILYKIFLDGSYDELKRRVKNRDETR